MTVSIEFTELLEAVSDERIRRWLINQLPERSRVTGDFEDYLADSVRVRYDPIQKECDN